MAARLMVPPARNYSRIARASAWIIFPPRAPQEVPSIALKPQTIIHFPPYLWREKFVISRNDDFNLICDRAIFRFAVNSLDICSLKLSVNYFMILKNHNEK